MKFFNWMHSKLNGGQGNRKQNAVAAANHIKPEAQKEEFSDWPNGLLSIGTFGNVSLKENPKRKKVQNQESETLKDEQIEQSLSPDLTEFSQEEIGQLQKELTKLLARKTAAKAETEIADLPLDRFLNCPSSLEVDRRISGALTTNSNAIDEDEIDRTIRLILGRCKDVWMENGNKSIGKKSVSFLLKKIFACRIGFAPAPSLRDTFQESRMEKLLRTMLSKKICPQSSSQASLASKFMEDRHKPRAEKEEEREGKTSDGGCKWVKTDSEFIVLEI